MQIQDHKKNGMQHALPKFSTIFSSDFYVARILLLSFLLLTVQEIQRHTLIFSVFNKQASHGIQPLDLLTGYSFQMGSLNCMDLPTVSLQEYRGQPESPVCHRKHCISTLQQRTPHIQQPDKMYLVQLNNTESYTCPKS